MKESISVSPRARIRVNHLVSQIVLPDHNLKFLDLVVQHVAAHFLVAFTALSIFTLVVRSLSIAITSIPLASGKHKEGGVWNTSDNSSH